MPLTELPFEQALVTLAREFGWRVAGFRPAQTAKGWRTPVKYDGKGYPDLTLVHASGVVIFAELKAGRGKRDADQVAWGDMVERCAAAATARLTEPDACEPIRYRLWHPNDANEIAAELSFGRVTRWTLPA